MYTHINRDEEDEISKHAKYMCPVCDSGRWGAVHGFEDKVLGLTIPIFHKHYKQVFEDKITKTKKCAKGKTVGPNECAIEAMAAYSEKTNRWERDVLTAGADPVFEAVMKISKKHAAPLQHLRHFLLKQIMRKLLKRMVLI